MRDQLADSAAKILVAAADLMPIVEAARPGTAVATVITTRYADLQPSQPACRKALAVPPELGLLTTAALVRGGVVSCRVLPGGARRVPGRRAPRQRAPGGARRG